MIDNLKISAKTERTMKKPVFILIDYLKVVCTGLGYLMLDVIKNHWPLLILYSLYFRNLDPTVENIDVGHTYICVAIGWYARWLTLYWSQNKNDSEKHIEE